MPFFGTFSEKPQVEDGKPLISQKIGTLITNLDHKSLSYRQWKGFQPFFLIFKVFQKSTCPRVAALCNGGKQNPQNPEFCLIKIAENTRDLSPQCHLPYKKERYHLICSVPYTVKRGPKISVHFHMTPKLIPLDVSEI